MDEPASQSYPQFRQDFAADFDIATAGLLPGYSGQPYALTRYGDGEAAIMRGICHRAKSDGWQWDGQQNHVLSGLLVDSLACRLPGYCVGVSAHNHHPHAHRWYREQLADMPPERLTLASLFIFANYDRLRSLNLSQCCIVAGHRSERVNITVPQNPTDPVWPERLSVVVDRLIRFARSPIIVSAGPWSCVLIHRYWLATQGDQRRQVILDVGSAIDELIRGRQTRRYHDPQNPQRRWVPRWNCDDGEQLIKAKQGATWP